MRSGRSRSSGSARSRHWPAIQVTRSTNPPAMSPSFFTPSSACFTTEVATRFTRATGDCRFRRAVDRLRALFFAVALRPAFFRAVDFRAVDFLRVDFRAVDFRRVDLRAVAPRRVLRADDLRALVARLRADFRAPDERFLEAFRPDFLLEDFLRVAIGQLLSRRVCTVQRKFHARWVRPIARAARRQLGAHAVDHHHRRRHRQCTDRSERAPRRMPAASGDAILRRKCTSVNTRCRHRGVIPGAKCPPRRLR